MNTPARLGAYALGLAAIFGVAFGVGAAVAPDAPPQQVDPHQHEHATAVTPGPGTPSGGTR